jgi:diguanylate cyclase (GGDEF)-like protein
MAVSSRSDRSIVGWALILASFVLVGPSVALFGLAQDRAVRSQDLAMTAEEVRLLDARRALELATLEVVAVRMLDGVGVAGDRSDRLASAAAAVRAATAEITTLARSEGPAADEARRLLDDVDLAALDNPTQGDLDSLFDVAEDYARWSGALDVVRTQRDATQQLSFVSTLPLHVLIEGIAADTSVKERSIDPSVAAFLDRAIETVRTEGGWFGSDPASPLTDSVWIEIEEGREMLPEAAARLTELVASSDMVRYDAWMRELGGGDDAPPFELAEMLAEADSLQPQLVAVIDQLVAEDDATRLSSVRARESARDGLLGAAVATGGLALAAFFAGSLLVSRATGASRERARLAMRDPLTGIGNRRELDERTSVLTMTPQFERHLVCMIDLDSFKMINDLYGHGAGDAILVEVAARLQQIAARVERESPGVATSVLRLGGDEFLLTVHAPDVVDGEFVLAELDAVRLDTIEYGDQIIDLGFSVGIVEVSGQNELADLMSAADLAVYADKADRVRSRAASEAVGRQPRPDDAEQLCPACRSERSVPGAGIEPARPSRARGV